MADGKKTLLYGSFEYFPCLYAENEAWVAFDGKTWTKHDSTEVGHSVQPLTKAEFDKAFPNVPPFPA